MKRINRINKMMNKEKIRKLRLEVASCIKEYGTNFLLWEGIREVIPIISWYSYQPFGELGEYYVPIFMRNRLKISCDGITFYGGKYHYEYRYLYFFCMDISDSITSEGKRAYLCRQFRINLSKVNVSELLSSMYRLYKIREYT